MKLSPSVRGIAGLIWAITVLARSDRGQRRVDPGPQRAEAMRVRRRHVDERDVERHGAGAEQARDVREEDRHVVGPALVHRLARVRTDEERPVTEVPRHRRVQVRAGPSRWSPTVVTPASWPPRRQGGEQGVGSRLHRGRRSSAHPPLRRPLRPSSRSHADSLAPGRAMNGPTVTRFRDQRPLKGPVISTRGRSAPGACHEIGRQLRP